MFERIGKLNAQTNEPTPQISRSPATLSHEAAPNARLQHSSTQQSSIAAGSFGATSTNPNSKLHQFRAVPSNSDQMTPQKNFSSPKYFPAAQLGSNKSCLPQNYGRSLMFERIVCDALVDRPPQTRDCSSGASGPAAPIAIPASECPKTTACWPFQTSATFRHMCQPFSCVARFSASHQIAPNRGKSQ
jgi:hypothetical protein